MNTPGLARFSRVIATKRDGQCLFCKDATRVGHGYAAVNASGKWIAICPTCAPTIAAQVAGTVRSIDALAAGHTFASDPLATVDMSVLGQVIAGTADENVAYAMLINLFAARNLIAKAVTPKDDLVEALRAIADDAAASPRNREFAASLVGQADAGRTLTERQREAAGRMVAAKGAPRTPLANGLYVVGPEGDWSSFWLIRTGRTSGNQYAMRLIAAPVAGEKLSWDYVKGGMAMVRNGRPATAAEAAGLGWATHHCCFCNLELTDEGDNRSVAVGYGPVCAKKNGLPWG
jgi:hypothetical protein